MLLTAKVRTVVYILTAILSPVVTYLGEQGKLDHLLGWFILLFVVTAVTALATVNVN